MGNTRKTGITALKPAPCSLGIPHPKFPKQDFARADFPQPIAMGCKPLPVFGGYERNPFAWRVIGARSISKQFAEPAILKNATSVLYVVDVDNRWRRFQNALGYGGVERHQYLWLAFLRVNAVWLFCALCPEPGT